MKPIEFILCAIALSLVLFFAIKKAHREWNFIDRLEKLEHRVDKIEPILTPP